MAAKKKGTARTCRTHQKKGGAARPTKPVHDVAEQAASTETAAPKRKPRLVTSAKSREREIEKAKSMIHGALPEIVAGIIEEAKSGNHNAAKFLMQFAGIGEFSAMARAAEKAKAAKAEAEPEREPLTPEEAVESFYKQLGMKPPVLLPPGVKPEDVGDEERWLVDREGKLVSGGFAVGVAAVSAVEAP